MKRKISLLMFSILLAAGCSSSKQEQREMPLPMVIVSPAVTEELSAAETFIGKVDAATKAAISVRVNGFLARKRVNEGDIVKKGQALFNIESDQYVAAVSQAKAAYEQSKATANNARMQKERGEALLKSAGISKARYDDIIVTFESANAAALQAKAALDLAELNLSYTTVTSPVTGKVGFINYQVGENISPASGVITTVIASDPMYVVFSISEKQMQEWRSKFKLDSKINLNKIADLKLVMSDGSYYEHSGLINFVDNAVTGATDAIRIRGQFPNPNGDLLQGQTVTVKMLSKKKTKQIVIRENAILTDIGGKYVMVATMLDAQKKTASVERRPVILGNILPGNRQIVTSGLKENDLIIVEGLQKIRPNTPVTAMTKEEFGNMMKMQAQAKAQGQTQGGK